MANMGAISVDIMANTRQFQRNMATVQATMDRVGSKMKSIGAKMTAAITVPIVGLGVAALKSAMDLEATEAKYKTVFGNMTKDADIFIKKFKELTPITTAAARSMTSGIQDLLVPMGFLREDATKLTGQFTHLIGSLTNFNSATHSAEDVALAFQSALTGEYMPLKRLGIQLDVATVKAKALEMGLIKEGQELTRQQKVLVLLSQAYKQSGDALAAYNAESLDTLTKLKLLTVKLQDTSAELATKFLPTVIKIIEKVNELADRFANLSPDMQKIILISAGIAAAIGPVILVLGMLISSLAAIAPVASAVAGALAFIITPVGAVVAGIAALIAVLVKAYKTNKTFRDNINKSWGAIAENVMYIINILKDDFMSLVEFLSNTWDKYGGVITSAVGATFDKINSIITGALDIIIGAVQFFISAFTQDWQQAWRGILNITKGAVKAINAMLETIGINVGFTKDLLVSLEQQTTVKKKPKPFDIKALAEEVEREKGIHPEQLKSLSKEEIKKQYEVDFESIFKDGLKGFESLESTGVSAFDKLNDATQRYIDTLKNQIDTFKTAFGIFDKPQIERISGERLFVRMQSQTKLFEKWKKALDVLRGKLGATSQLFQQVAQQGPGALGQTMGLAGLSAEKLATLEAGMGTRAGISTEVATGLVGQQIREEQKMPTVNLNGGVYVGDMAQLANLIARELKLSGVT